MKYYPCPRPSGRTAYLIAFLLFTGFIAPAQNLIVNGSMNGRQGEGKTVKGWSTVVMNFLNTPDVNDDSGPAHTTAGYQWAGGSPSPSPDGGTWQNVFGQEAFSQTITGLTPGQSYHFSYYYCTQGLEEIGQLQYVTPILPKLTIDGATGYIDPVIPGDLFSWSRYDAVIVASGTDITITVSCASDAYLAFDGFYLGLPVPDLPEIGEQPSSYTSCAHGSAKFKVRARHASAYQWQENQGSEWKDLSDDNNYQGSASQDLSILDAHESCNGYRYQCLVKSSCCQIATKPVALSVVVAAEPGLAIQSSSDPVCAGSMVSFTATATNEGPTPVFQWLKNNHPVGSNSASFTSVSLAEGDEISCMLVSSSSCRTLAKAVSNKISVHVRPIVPTDLSITASALTVCEGTPVNFTAVAVNPGTTPDYHWKKNGIMVGANSDRYTDERVQDGDVIKCYLLSSETCATPSPTVSNAVTLKVFPVLSPAISISADHAEVCTGTPITFTATPMRTDLNPQYTWTKNGSVVPGNSNVFIDFNPVSGQQINCAVYTAYGCASSPSRTSNNIVTIVHAIPVVALDTNPVICEGATRVLHAGPFSRYLWTDGSDQESMSVRSPGTYGVRVTDASGCIGGDTVSVPVLGKLPAAFMPADTAVCGYGELSLIAAGGYPHYLWNTGSTTSINTIHEPGTYTLEVTGVDGCSARGSVTVYPKNCLAGFFMPNAFSPNSDGKNDLFRPTILGQVKYYRMKIFNRWGQQVFISSDPQNGWNGESRGVKNNPETFVWTCVFELEDGVRQTRTGKMILLR